MQLCTTFRLGKTSIELRKAKRSPDPSPPALGKKYNAASKKETFYMIDAKGKESKYSVIGISKVQ